MVFNIFNTVEILSQHGEYFTGYSIDVICKSGVVRQKAVIILEARQGRLVDRNNIFRYRSKLISFGIL